MRRRLLLLLLLLLLGESLLEACALAGVVLPVQDLLLVYKLGALGIYQLLPEMLVLQQLQHVQAMRISGGETVPADRLYLHTPVTNKMLV